MVKLKKAFLNHLIKIIFFVLYALLAFSDVITYYYLYLSIYLCDLLI